MPTPNKPESEAEAHYRCHASVQTIQRMLCEYERALDSYNKQPLMLADSGKSPTQRLEDAAIMLSAMTGTLLVCTRDRLDY